MERNRFPATVSTNEKVSSTGRTVKELRRDSGGDENRPERLRLNNRNAAFAKRQRELKQQEKAREKLQRKAERASRGSSSAEDGIDPDIAGIVPGPQPRSDEDGGSSDGGTGGEDPPA
jgi:hypothetical protein